MKIAIQGHPTRGKEVIQILESLGGINTEKLEGTYKTFYYIDDKNEIGDDHKQNFPSTYKLYTLDEFESEFPFKIGDIVVVNGFNKPHKIVALEFYVNKLYYKLDNGFHFSPMALTTYEKMREERNITLTLDKAKEWYKKGGELKEIALQAFSEKELNPLPKTWEEFCRNNPVKPSEAIICSESTVVTCDYPGTRDSDCNREICPSRKSAEAHLAMIQLEQLRDCYNNNSEAWGWSYSIIKRGGIPELVRGCDHDTFLRFNNETIAKEFLKCFKDLIEKAGDLI